MLLPGSVHTDTLVEGWHWQSSFFPICCIETHLFSCCFFHTWCARISSQKGWTSTHSLVCAYLPKVALSKFSQPWLGGVGQVCWFCSPYQRLSAFPNAQVGKTPPRSFDKLLLDLTSPTETLLWMDA